MYHTCLGENCDQVITWRFALCSKCEKRYGRSPLKWPKWLRFLWNDTQRQRRREKKIREHEVPYFEEYC